MPKPENLIPAEKGEVRNPNGRPKGSLNRATIAKQWLEAMESAKNPITGENERLTQADIITLAQIKKARKGDTHAYKALMDSGFGLPKQEIDNTSSDGTMSNTGLECRSFPELYQLKYGKKPE
jgi:hypothetical protein